MIKGAPIIRGVLGGSRMARKRPVAKAESGIRKLGNRYH
jgi:hypothetical protein